MRVKKHFMESLIQDLVSCQVIWELCAGLLQPSKEKSIEFVQEGKDWIQSCGRQQEEQIGEAERVKTRQKI